jgi:hypothetical protein
MKIHLVSKANITYLKEKQHLHRRTFGFIALCDKMSIGNMVMIFVFLLHIIPIVNADSSSLRDRSVAFVSRMSEMNYTQLANVHNNCMMDLTLEGFSRDKLGGTDMQKKSVETHFNMILTTCRTRVVKNPQIQKLHKEYARCSTEIKDTAFHMMTFDKTVIKMKDINFAALDPHERFMLGLDSKPTCHGLINEPTFIKFCETRNLEIVKLGKDGVLGGVNSDMTVNFKLATEWSEDFRRGITTGLFTPAAIDERTDHFRLCALTHINANEAMEEQKTQWVHSSYQNMITFCGVLGGVIYNVVTPGYWQWPLALGVPFLMSGFWFTLQRFAEYVFFGFLLFCLVLFILVHIGLKVVSRMH